MNRNEAVALVSIVEASLRDVQRELDRLGTYITDDDSKHTTPPMQHVGQLDRLGITTEYPPGVPSKTMVEDQEAIKETKEDASRWFADGRPIRRLHCAACGQHTIVVEGATDPIQCFHCLQPFQKSTEPWASAGELRRRREHVQEAYSKPKPPCPTPAGPLVELTRPEMRRMAFDCLEGISKLWGPRQWDNWVYYTLCHIVEALATNDSTKLRNMHADVEKYRDATIY